MVQENMSNDQGRPDIVISGISGQFPMSSNMEEFMNNLFKGVDLVTADDLRWPVGLVRLPARNGKVYDMDKFDRKFFNLSHEETELIDPQDRLLMEAVYTALLDAGVNPESLRGTNTGYFHGACYTETNIRFENAETVPENHPKALVTRIPLFLGLRGPVLDVDTACGSGLSAFAEAYHSVKYGLCDSAIATASNTVFRPRISAQFKDLKMINKDGTCKCLDASGDGYVRSEAIVATYIQRSNDARRVYCYLLACRSNSDGHKEEGITFPSIKGQIKLLTETYAAAGVDPKDIEYIEAHITGTKAGDPVETTAMYDVIASKKQEPLLVGCLKSNIGHTEGSSGLCAIAKACIVYQTSLIPPNIHYNTPNTGLKGIADGKLKPVTQITPFKGKYIPVNCFGFGGANTHLITSSVPSVCQSPDERKLNHQLTHPQQPPIRLILAPGRTKSAVEYIFSSLLTQRKYCTREFLCLLDNFATVEPRSNGFNERGFALLDTSSTVKSWTFKPDIQTVSACPPQLILELKGPEAVTAKTYDRCCQLGIIDSTLLDDALCKINNNASETELIIGKTVALQIAVIQLLRKLKINVTSVYGISTGQLAAAYFDGLITDSIAVEAAFHVQKQLDKFIDCNSFISQKKSSRWLTQNGGISNGHQLEESINRLNNHFNQNVRVSHTNQLVIEVGLNLMSIDKMDSSCNIVDSSDPYINLLTTLGHLYCRGISMDISALYPAVEFPLPACTPFFSNLIKWDYSAPSNIKQFLYDPIDSVSWQTTKNIIYRYDSRKADEAFVFDHKVNERALFPATGYLMIVWSTLAKMKRTVITELPVKFTGVKFLRATVLNNDTEAILSVRLNEDSGSFEVKEGDNIVVKGRVKSIDHTDEITCLSKNVDDQCNRMKEQAGEVSSFITAKDIYKELRVRGYEYGPFFQGMLQASHDGSQGTVIWRDVVSKGVKETLGLETEEDQANLWGKSWCAFMDSMLQLQLINCSSDNRCLLVPTSIESLIVFPDQVKKSIANSCQLNDGLTQNTASAVIAYNSRETGSLCTQGILLSGFKGSFMARKKQQVKLFDYSFVPFNVDQCIDSSFHDHLANYCKTVNTVLTGSNDHVKQSNQFDLQDNQFAYLKSILANDDSIDLSNDLIKGSLGQSHILTHQKFFKTSLDTAVYNLIAGGNSKKTLNVLEINLHAKQCDLLVNRISETLNTHLLSNSYSCDYSLVHRKPSDLDESDSSQYDRLVEATVDTVNLPSSSLVIFNCSSTPSDDLIKSIFSCMIDGAFIYIICQESQEILDAFIQSGLMLVSHKRLSPLLPYHGILLRKASSMINLPLKVIQVGTNDYSLWLDQLKEAIAAADSRVVLVNKRDATFDHKNVTGLLGMVKSLRLEMNGEFVRTVIDFSDKHDQVDLSRLQTLDLAYSVKLDSNEGTFEHMLLPEEAVNDANAQILSDHVYLRSLKPGDLNSLTWVQNQVAHEARYLTSHVQVHFSALNFKDVLFATGRLPMDAIAKNMSPLVAQDTLLGLEYSGIVKNTSRRVMGILPCKALASSIPIVPETEEFMWPVPDSWSLEDAATVPVVYSTVIYALLIRGKLRSRESVLIHAGAGGVGLAAINVALAFNCQIFTTVGSEEKKQFLLREFNGRIDEKHIFNSRNTDFEDQIKEATDGFGVSVILNSLSDEKFLSTLNCLSDDGRFLEIGKVDMLADREINLSHQLSSNQSFHGVFLDTLMQYSSGDYFSQQVHNDKNKLRHLMSEGIEKGYVKPLPRVIFDKSKVTDAFRFMATGKHIGKVLLQMRSCQSLSETKCIKSTFFSMDKSYLVIGGLGGLGLELVQWLVARGARFIVINSRRGISTSLQKWTISRLTREGIKVIVSQADATQEEGAKDLIDTANSLAPLGGIFNSAVVYNDCLFADATVEMFEQAVSPKATVTLHLDKLSRSLCPQLDYFVTFSSISSGRGNEGQTNYNFGNSLMDSVCQSRVSAGLHGLSVQWGVIGDVGLVAELHSSSSDASNGTISHSNAPSEVVLLGSASQRVHSVFETLERLLAHKKAACVASIVLPSFSGRSGGKEGAGDLIKVISNVIGLKDITLLDANATLGSLGIDSLIAVEVKQVIERILDISLSLKEVRDLTVAQIQQMARGGSGQKQETVAEAAPAETNQPEQPKQPENTQ